MNVDLPSWKGRFAADGWNDEASYRSVSGRAVTTSNDQGPLRVTFARSKLAEVQSTCREVRKCSSLLAFSFDPEGGE